MAAATWFLDSDMKGLAAGYEIVDAGDRLDYRIFASPPYVPETATFSIPPADIGRRGRRQFSAGERAST